jgi:hypothetical protein
MALGLRRGQVWRGGEWIAGEPSVLTCRWRYRRRCSRPRRTRRPDFDADFWHAEDVGVGKGGLSPCLVGPLPFEDGHADACRFADGIAPDGGHGRILADLDDAIGTAGRRAEDLENDDDARHCERFAVQLGACHQRIGITNGAAHRGNAGIGSEWLTSAAPQPAVQDAMVPAPRGAPPVGAAIPSGKKARSKHPCKVNHPCKARRGQASQPIYAARGHNPMQSGAVPPDDRFMGRQWSWVRLGTSGRYSLSKADTASDDLPLPEVLNLRRGVAELRQDGVVMLAQSGRDSDPRGRCGKLPR